MSEDERKAAIRREFIDPLRGMWLATAFFAVWLWFDDLLRKPHRH